MMYSILFLEYDPDGINLEMSHKSLASVIECSKDYDYELVHVKNVKGFVNAVNEGLMRAKGDYIVMVANDVYLEDPKWLTKMTKEGALVGWRMTPLHLTGELRPDFACWGMSRKVFEEIGYMDSQYAAGYGFDDDDYVYTAKSAGFSVADAGVQLIHLESVTYNTVFKKDKQAMTYLNEGIFRDKWNI